MNNLEIAIGEKIKSLRKKRGITQEQLADYLKISFQSVSKWECSDAYPDITMLPKIAMFFGVTTDELLCIDKIKEQEEIDKYTKRHYKALHVGHTEEAVAILREANAKFPGNYTIMRNLIYVMNMDVLRPGHNAEYIQITCKEIILIGERILAECKDNETRHGTVEVMCSVYSRLGKKEKAIKIINENLSDIWRSREHMVNNVLEGEELIKHRRQTLYHLTELLSWEMYHLSQDSAPKDRLVVLENIIKIYSYVFHDGNYGYYHIKVLTFHVDATAVYLDTGDNSQALEHIKRAAYHAVTFDKLNPSAVGLITNEKGNQSYNLLKNLDSEKLNPIRDTLEFKEIYENLKEYAKEDN